MSRGDDAYDYFVSGYNCSQSVALAFSDVIGIEKDVLAKLSSGFGGGMGRMREVCGCFSGIVMVLSQVYGYSEPSANAEKKALYEKIRAAAERFREDNGSIICKELLGLENPEKSAQPEARTSEYYQKRPCPQLCRYAAELAETMINEK